MLLAKDYPYSYDYFTELNLDGIALNKLRKIQNSIFKWTSLHLPIENGEPLVAWVDRAGFIYTKPTNMVSIQTVVFRHQEDMFLFLMRWKGTVGNDLLTVA